ncbi:hypothetical protein [Nocardia sp. NPDC052566]|uniref:hypothetical protein n=1 Tax=Nocardia sp. NPDC052566 TaxID=3364330 RepID=UPI0037C848F3
MGSTTLGLETWFAPLGIDEFGPATCGRRPLYVPPDPDVAGRVMRALDIGSVDEVLSFGDATMFAWFTKLDDRQTAARIPTESARRFYDGGTTIYGPAR